MYYHFKHPFTMILAGPSMNGKTTFLKNVLVNREKMFDVKFKKILWCYSESSSKPDIQGIEFFKGIPQDFNNLRNEETLIILDDLMSAAYNSTISELFTKGSHHRNTSVVLVTQNLYHQTSHSRNISLNAKYIVLFKKS